MKKTFIIFTFVAILFINITCVNAQLPDIDARSYILVDSKTGQVLIHYNLI